MPGLGCFRVCIVAWALIAPAASWAFDSLDAGLNPQSSILNPYHAGPLFDHFDLTLAAGQRTEIAGPFYYSEEMDTARIWAVPPLFSYARDPGTESVEIDFVYPVLAYDRYGEQYRWHIFQLFSFAGGPTQQESARDR